MPVVIADGKPIGMIGGDHRDRLAMEVLGAGQQYQAATLGDVDFNLVGIGGDQATTRRQGGSVCST